jgi:hypothetical protein
MVAVDDFCIDRDEAPNVGTGLPLSVLNITRTDLEADGIGVMLGQGEGSCVDTIPNDLATTDTVGRVSPGNSPLEWADVDSLTTAYARIGHE